MIKEKIEQVTVSDVTAKVKKGLENGRGTLALAIAGAIVSLCSSFMFCFASIGFDFSQLSELVFWSRWASMALSTFCVYLLVILHKDEVNRLNDWYVEKLKTIAEKSTVAGELFDAYLMGLNMKRRIEWYKHDVNRKIAKQNHKLLQLELKRRTARIEKKITTVKNKIQKYQEWVSEAYIEEHKNALKTRSKPISASQVLSEATRTDNGEVNFRSASAYYGGKSFIKVLLSLALTATFSCVVVQNFESGINVASIVMTILTVLSIFISIVSAILAANGCYRNVYVPNLLFRLKILTDFENYKKNQ